MTNKNQATIADLETDPFNERGSSFTSGALQLLGGEFTFRSNSAQLMRLVDAAYRELPAHRFTMTPRRFDVTLHLAPDASRPTRRMPAPLTMLSGADLLAAGSNGADFAVLSPGRRTALISVSRAMLKFPYNARYELIEFTVFTLASRSQRLVPLHAACVGLNNRGVLLMGESGAGKSTLSLQCLLDGFQFLAEDSVFVAPGRLLATGTPNFLHVRTDSVDWLGKSSHAALIRRSPVIERRSGVRKFEVDLRRTNFHLAPKPLKLMGLVFLSAKKAGRQPLLSLLSKRETVARLRGEQAYGASLPQWKDFQRQMTSLGAYELRRGVHPREGSDALRGLLEHR